MSWGICWRRGREAIRGRAASTPISIASFLFTFLIGNYIDPLLNESSCVADTATTRPASTRSDTNFCTPYKQGTQSSPRSRRGRRSCVIARYGRDATRNCGNLGMHWLISAPRESQRHSHSLRCTLEIVRGQIANILLLRLPAVVWN